MELVLTQQDTEPSPKPKNEFVFGKEGLLNSNYKSVVAQNYTDASSKSVFGIRQHLKYKSFNTINHIGVVLKLSIFAAILAMIF